MKFYYDENTKKVINHCYYDEDTESEKKGFPSFELTIREWGETLACIPFAKAYFYRDGKLLLEDDKKVMATNEYKMQIANEQIEKYQQYLTDTDYIITKLNEAKLEDDTEFEVIKAQYSEQLTKRKEARSKINELQQEIASLK